MKKIYFYLSCLIIIALGVYGYNNLDNKINKLEKKTVSIQKKIVPLFEDQEAPEDSIVLDSPFGIDDLAEAMAGGERAVYIRCFTGLTGGTTGDLDKITNANLDDNDLGLVFDVQGDYSAGSMLMYYWDEDTDVSELVPRYIESDTDGGSSGTWILMNGWTSGPTSTPSVVFRDSNAAGTDEWADLLAGSINFNMSVTTEGSEIVDWDIKSMIGGSEVKVLEWDGDGEVLTIGDSSTGEDMTWDMDTGTANQVQVSTNSSLNLIIFSSIGLQADFFLDDNLSLQFLGDADGMDEDEYNGIVITGRNCGETLVQWDTVFLNSAEGDGGDIWHKADATTGSGEFPAFGLSIAACTDTNEAKILVKGVVRNDTWTWTTGDTIYLGETDGALTSTAPSTSGDCVQIVGWALSADEVYFDFSRPYLEVE